MYKVFVKDVAIIVTSQKEDFPEYKEYSLKKVDLVKVIHKIESGKLKKVLLYHKNPEKLKKLLHKKLPLVKAAGGLVVSDENKFLFIHRNGKWDLPKGKKEFYESMRKAAKREVKEETGVKGLTVIKPLGKTYHIYNWKAKLKLKQTKWYVMHSDYAGPLVPQFKEGIDQAVWLEKENAQQALMHSYANIKELFPDLDVSHHLRDI